MNYHFKINVKMCPLKTQVTPALPHSYRGLIICCFRKAAAWVSIFVLNPYKKIIWNLKYHISIWGDELTLMGKLLRIFTALSPFTEPLSCSISRTPECYLYKSFDPLLNGHEELWEQEMGQDGKLAEIMLPSLHHKIQTTIV